MKKHLGFVLVFLLLIPSLAFAIDLSNVKFGGQVRLRGYVLENPFDFQSDGTFGPFDADWDNYSVFRLKASVFTSIDVGDNVTGYVKLTNQNYGEGVTGAEGTTEIDNTSNKVFLDNAYINVKNLLNMPLTLRMGRQNLIYGSGFVILDGQSQFASTSIYFDGVKLGWSITDNILLDVFYMKDQENVRNESVDDDITLKGVYLTAKGMPVIGKGEVYFLNRKDESSEKNINMYGLRLSDKIDFGLDYAAEVALQGGDSYLANVDQDALGLKLDLGFTFKDLNFKPRIFGQYAFMSGDEAGTADYEGWDVFYGGWPQFGDLLAWKFVNIAPNNVNTSAAPFPGINVVDAASGTVAGEAAYSNFSIATIGFSCSLLGKISPKISYSKITIDETAAGMDDDFGDYFQVEIKYAYSKALSFRIYAAKIEPGDAFGTLNDAATEFFWEADLKF